MIARNKFAPVSDLSGNQVEDDSQTLDVAAELSSVESQGHTVAHPPDASDGSNLPLKSNSGTIAIHDPISTGFNFSVADQKPDDTHRRRVDDGELSLAASQADTDTDPDSHPYNARSEFISDIGGWLRDPVLGVLADALSDLEDIRIRNNNRYAQLTRTEPDKDGGIRGFGLTPEHPEIAKLALIVDVLEKSEKDATLNLQRSMRKHPLVRFQKEHRGIGEKQFARLLAAIGDPYWNDLYSRPRTVSELWAYCGFHVIKSSSNSQSTSDAHVAVAVAGIQLHTGYQPRFDAHRPCVPGVAPRRKRGEIANWSDEARKRVWLIASAMPKFPGSKYERVYRESRIKYAESVHSVDCVRCGPSGKPALVGSPLSDGHKHARAVRIVAKEILKDVWLVSRDLYEERLEEEGIL